MPKCNSQCLKCSDATSCIITPCDNSCSILSNKNNCNICNSGYKFKSDQIGSNFCFNTTQFGNWDDSINNLWSKCDSSCNFCSNQTSCIHCVNGYSFKENSKTSLCNLNSNPLRGYWFYSISNLFKNCIPSSSTCSYSTSFTSSPVPLIIWKNQIPIKVYALMPLLFQMDIGLIQQIILSPYVIIYVIYFLIHFAS